MRAIPLDLKALKVELVRRDTNQCELARVLGVPASTLGSWLRGVAPAPADLRNRIAAALGVSASLLAPNSTNGDE